MPDPLPGWWRYHQLLADLLRVRLQQEPERVPGLHRGAACWSQAHGLAGQAVRQALAASDRARAARLVERHAHELLLAQAHLALPCRAEGVAELLHAAERALAHAADRAC